jgi:hypothetical protein
MVRKCLRLPAGNSIGIIPNHGKGVKPPMIKGTNTRRPSVRKAPPQTGENTQ